MENRKKEVEEQHMGTLHHICNWNPRSRGKRMGQKKHLTI